MSANDIMKLVDEKEAKFIDYRFTNTQGKEQHVTVTATEDGISTDCEEGKMFDGSSIAGWKGINESDMVLMPDASTAVLDPFTEEVTLNIRCDIVEPSTMEGYDRDPRSIAKRALEFLRSTGIADDVFFGAEPEFFLFDDVKFHTDMSGYF